MGITSEEALAISRVYTYTTVMGAGAVKGKNCTVESITPITGGNRITFKWSLDDGTERTSTLDVMNGTIGPQGDAGRGIASISASTITPSYSDYIIYYDDGTTDPTTIRVYNGETGPKGDKGDVGDDGFSPIIVEDPNNTEDIYKLDITDVNHTFITPNLKGSGGGTMNYNALNNLPQINGVTLTGNKSASDLGINIPTKTSDLTNDSNFVESSDLADVATSGDYDDLLNKPTIPTKTSDLTNDSDFITNAVNNLLNYYLKTETYSKTEVDNIITAVKNSRFEVVNVLPTTDIQTNVIYLVPKSSSLTNNVKDEYINLDGTSAGWEKIGDTEIDLSSYVNSISVNGVAQTISNSAVNLNVADNLITEAQWTTLSTLWAV